MFFYDQLGRIVASQNSKQHDNQEFSYSIYDAQGRVFEAGVKKDNAHSGETPFKNIFGANINGIWNQQVINNDYFNAWILGSGLRTEVTRTYYDYDPQPEQDEDPVPAIDQADPNHALKYIHVDLHLPEGFDQDNTRKRVAAVFYQATYEQDITDDNYDHATFYNYDIHGNVCNLLQDNPAMAITPELADQRYKQIEYEYDLISGNVHRVSYQKGEADAFHHRYFYDADNRITDVYTTKTKQPLGIPEAGFGWDHDARYYYYDHGPLARTELGDNLVQGVDYAYTLQGWLKGVNSNELDPTKDMGHDGATGPNQNVAADAFSFSLHYNAGDYQAIGGATAQQWLKDMAGTALEADRKDLWNGNIGMVLTNISLPTGLTPGANDRPGLLGNVYAYDQLNRLKEARSDWDNGSGFGATYHTTDMYLNTFNYDANGNILNQKRNNQLGNTIDDLRYTYDGTSPSNMVNNRLYSVFDQVASSTFDDDIDAEDMSGTNYDFDNTTGQFNTNSNYIYTKLGELKSDEQEQIEEIVWRVDSKISEVRRTSGSSKKTLRFGYDAMGNRTAKYVYNDAAMTQLHSSTYYVHDATGNVMAVYEKLEVATNARSTNFALIERHIFGSSRLGMDNSPVEYLSESPAGRAPYSPDDAQIIRILSQKQYELTNHLGNVLATISDRKLYSVMFSAEVVTSSDYSPFGVTLDGREFSKSYRYGFQNQEADKELWEGAVTYKYRVEDPRLGRFFSVDPLYAKYPYYSCYQFSGNRMIDCVELEGLEPASANPTQGIDRRTARNLAKFDRKEARLAARNGLTAGTQASRALMDRTYGNKRWYYSVGDGHRSQAGQSEDSDHFLAMSELANKRDQYNAWINTPRPAPGFVNINLGSCPSQRDPVTGRIEMSIPIVGNGTVQTSIQFQGGTGSDQATMWVSQDNVQFGSTNPINGITGETQSGQNTSSAGNVNNVNIANGRFLTVEISGSQLGTAQTILYGVTVSQGMVQNPPPNPTFIVSLISLRGDAKWDSSARLNRITLNKLYTKLTNPRSNP